MEQTVVVIYPGALYFKYEWKSTTGEKADLSNCVVRERVDYPGGNPYCFPRPWTSCWINPTLLPSPPMPATSGELEDWHVMPKTERPFQNASSVATQVYQYHCGPSCCMEEGEYETLLNIGPIMRVFSGEDGLWRYSIIKSGCYAELFPIEE
jgi:hypothetical protein